MGLLANTTSKLWTPAESTEFCHLAVFELQDDINLFKWINSAATTETVAVTKKPDSSADEMETVVAATESLSIPATAPATSPTTKKVTLRTKGAIFRTANFTNQVSNHDDAEERLLFSYLSKDAEMKTYQLASLLRPNRFVHQWTLTNTPPTTYKALGQQSQPRVRDICTFTAKTEDLAFYSGMAFEPIMNAIAPRLSKPVDASKPIMLTESVTPKIFTNYIVKYTHLGEDDQYVYNAITTRVPSTPTSTTTPTPTTSNPSE